MNEVIIVNKPIGVTSYDVIRDLKKKYPGEKIGHAGTLDPLASGVLICLVGKEATKRQSEFMNVSKTYEFEVLFGFETDTYDVLGLVNEVKEYAPEDVELEVKEALKKFQGPLKQKVPPFSAVKIKGRPLYRWYLDGKIDEVEIPEKEITVDEISVQDIQTLTSEGVKSRITDLVNTVRSGFRQKEVLKGWDEVFEGNKQEKFLIAKIKADVSKGTYVRAIAHELGQSLGIGACTLEIRRTRVGDSNVENAIKVDE